MTHGLWRRSVTAGLALLVPLTLSAGPFSDRAAATPITAILVNTTSDQVDPGDGTLTAGGTYLIKAKVKVTSSAPGGSSVTRLVLLTSVADGSKQDAVKFTVSRK
jgi:hypothetical protein